MYWTWNRCIMCRAEAHQLYAKKPIFDALGVQLYAVLHEHIESEVFATILLTLSNNRGLNSYFDDAGERLLAKVLGWHCTLRPGLGFLQSSWWWGAAQREVPVRICFQPASHSKLQACESNGDKAELERRRRNQRRTFHFGERKEWHCLPVYWEELRWLGSSCWTHRDLHTAAGKACQCFYFTSIGFQL